MTIGGRVVRGRMDAVFAPTADGRLAGRRLEDRPPPDRRRGAAAAVQLAAYRLAWARLSGIADDELHRVRAAFHYVRSNETVEPAACSTPTACAPWSPATARSGRPSASERDVRRGARRARRGRPAGTGRGTARAVCR